MSAELIIGIAIAFQIFQTIIICYLCIDRHGVIQLASRLEVERNDAWKTNDKIEQRLDQSQQNCRKLKDRLIVIRGIADAMNFDQVEIEE